MLARKKIDFKEPEVGAVGAAGVAGVDGTDGVVATGEQADSTSAKTKLMPNNN
jgi:hypothetical protein